MREQCLIPSHISVSTANHAEKSAMEEFSRKRHNSFRWWAFSEFNWISAAHRLNPSEGIRDMGIRFPISSSVISGWTNQSSPSLSISLSLSSFSPAQAALRKCIIELASGCALLWRLDAGNVKSDSGVRGWWKRGREPREEKSTLRKVCSARSLLKRCYLTQLRYFIPLFRTIVVSLYYVSSNHIHVSNKLFIIRI